MIKRKVLLFLFFLFIFIINWHFVLKLEQKYKSSKRSEKIFLEINQIAQNENLFNNYLLPETTSPYQPKIFLADNRIANLKAFFRKYNSPLYHYAQKIVEISDKYHFDYRLLPAIAMQESNLCLKIPENSYNCWGWGIYGDKVTRFSSYDEAIEVIAKGIKTEYLDKGLITASQIMKKYTPPSQGSWAYGVNLFLKALE